MEMKSSCSNPSLISKNIDTELVSHIVTRPRYISNIEMAGGKVVYVPLTPPLAGQSQSTSAGEWLLDREKLENAIGPKTKMIVCI
jgi:aspartate/methionine/tyrosine aminotransferase